MKQTPSRIIAVLLTLIMVCSMLACTSAPAQEAAPAAPAASGEAAPTDGEAAPTSTKDTLIVANKGDPGTLAPFQETAMDRARITSTIYETLMFLDESGELLPVLATEWEWTDDTHVRFKLREGVQFHNGNTFNADDVHFSLTSAINSPTVDVYSAIDLPNCKVIDEYTYELALKQPDSIILSKLGASSYLSIVDKETCEADPDSMGTNPVGTGPYMYKDWIIGDTVTVERFEGYWGEPAPIKTIVYRKVAEASQRVIELETGGVDFAYDIPFSSVEGLKANPNLKVLERPGLLINNLYFNAVAPDKPLADVNLRRAISYAIDYDAILKGAALGAGAVPASFASRASIGSNVLNPSGEPWRTYDLDKAKEYMAETAYANTPLTLEFYLNADNAFMVSAVEILANQLKEIGITLNITQNSLGPLIGFVLDSNNPWDIVFFGNAEGTVLLQAARFDKAQCPFLTPHTDEMQAICDRLWACTDPVEANNIAAELNDYVVDNVIIIPINENLQIDASVANLDGFVVDNQSYVLQKMFFN